MELRSIRRKKTNTAAEDEALIEVLIKVKIEEQTRRERGKRWAKNDVEVVESERDGEKEEEVYKLNPFLCLDGEDMSICYWRVEEGGRR